MTIVVARPGHGPRRIVDGMTDYKTGLLIIRAWTEPGSALPLRGHVRLTDDITLSIQRAQTLTDPNATADIVRAWLQGPLDNP